MTYKKPAHMHYTTMAIYIDEHVYTDDCDDIKVYEYCYHLINMLAHQGAYFKNSKYYDDFAIQGATRVFLRLKNSKQFETNPDGTPKMEKIRSVLNYIKNILYPMKVTFERENFKQINACNPEDTAQMEKLQIESGNNFHTYLEQSVDELRLIDFDMYLHDVSKTARALIEKIPKKKNDPEWMNIYLSCILTFLNSITLNNNIRSKLYAMRFVILQKPEILDKLYKEERSDCVILYHLSENYRNYIIVLVNRLRHLLARDLQASYNICMPASLNAKNLLLASLEEDNEENT